MKKKLQMQIKPAQNVKGDKFNETRTPLKINNY